LNNRNLEARQALREDKTWRSWSEVVGWI